MVKQLWTDQLLIWSLKRFQALGGLLTMWRILIWPALVFVDLHPDLAIPVWTPGVENPTRQYRTKAAIQAGNSKIDSTGGSVSRLI